MYPMFMIILIEMCVQNFMMIGKILYAWKSNKNQTHFHIYNKYIYRIKSQGKYVHPGLPYILLLSFMVLAVQPVLEGFYAEVILLHFLI